MTANRIRLIVRLLPADSPYWRLVFTHGARASRSYSIAQRFQIALADYGFGWHLASSYADAGVPLPDGIFEPAILRAYHFQRDPNKRDIEIAQARDMTLPQNKWQRDLVRALLVRKEGSFETIAQHCGLTAEVVMLFEGLFWNCRDRLNEPIYLARLCRQGVFARTSGDLPSNPLSIAYWNGSIQDIAAEADVAPLGGTESPVENYRVVRHGLLARAVAGLRLGRLTPSENPALVPALRIVAQIKKARPTEKEPICCPRAADAVAMSLHGITEQEEQYQRALECQRLAAQRAAEAQAAPASASQAPPAS